VNTNRHLICTYRYIIDNIANRTKRKSFSSSRSKNPQWLKYAYPLSRHLNNMNQRLLQHHIARLQKSLGISLYAVGGCVRDTLLGREIKDYDFTCQSNSDEIKARIGRMGKRAYIIGQNPARVTFKDELLGMIEITPFCNGGRFNSRPVNKMNDSSAANLESDLSCRDFTMNALAMDSQGKIFDILNGQDDLAKGIIKCIGDPCSCFGVDPLRILRCLRFAVELNFQIHESIISICELVAHTILRISKETIVDELEKMFFISIDKSLRILRQLDIIDILFPEAALGNETAFSQFLERWSSHRENVTAPRPIFVAKGWGIILEYIATLLAKRTNGDFVEKRRIFFRNLVSKYAMFLKFSNMRTSLLQQWKFSTDSVQ
jgi:tRNA nucleotidyltransferase/poly(A) polymerase